MRKSFLMLFFLGFLVMTVSPGKISAQDRGGPPQPVTPAPPVSIGLPSVNLSADNGVPIGIVRSVALKRAKEMWGQVVPGEPIPCADQDGKLAYFMVPFHFGPNPFPSYDQIMEGVRKGREQVDQVQKGDIDPELLKATPPTAPANIILHGNKDMVLTTKSGAAASSPEAEYQKAFKAAKKKEMGIGEFGTIFVAATYDRFPIPLMTDYLPPYYYTGDLAKVKAKEELGGEATLSRIFFLGERGIYFEFASGGTSAMIHAFTIERGSFKHLAQTAPTPAQVENVKAAWRTLTP